MLDMNPKSRRIGAFAIDAALVLGSIPLVLSRASAFAPDWRSVPLSAIPGILILGILVGKTGRSPGKAAMGLRVASSAGDPGLGKGIVRELIRFLSLPILALPLLYLAVWLQGGELPYDRFLGFRVEDDRPRPK